MTTSHETAIALALSDEQIAEAMTRLDAIDTYDPDVMTEADDISLTDLGTVLSAALKRAKDEEQRITAPILEGVEQIRAKFRPTRTALTLAIDKARALIATYRGVARRRAETAEAERQRAAQAVLEAQRKASAVDLPAVEDAVAPGMFDAPAPANVTRGALGTSTGRKNPARFEVLDLAAAVVAYPHLFTLDEAKARLELRALQARDPAAKLTGIRHWYPESVSFGTRR